MIIQMNKKNTKNLTDQQPIHKYNKVFVNQQRSPNSGSSSNFKAQKMAEYASSDRSKLPLSPEPSSSQRSHLQQQTKQNDSKGSKEGQRQLSRKEPTQANNSRSKSKEKKDRLTLNLAKFNRKPTDKVKSPTSSTRQKNVESIYLQRGETLVQAESSDQHSSHKTNQRKEEQHEKIISIDKSSIEKSQNANRRSFFSEDFQSIISEAQQPNNTVTIREPVRSKPEDVIKSKIEDNIKIKPQIPKRQVSRYSQIQQRKETYSQPPELKSTNTINTEKVIEHRQSRTIGSQGLIDRQVYEMLRGQQNAAVQELNHRLRIQKQESDEAIRKLQSQKRQLQQKNRNFIESQFKLKNQVQILKVKNIELIKQSNNIKQLYESSEMMRQSEGNMKTNTVAELKEKFQKANRQLQVKQNQNSQLTLNFRQLEGKCGELQNRIKMYQNQRRIKSREVEVIERQNKNELQELINAYNLKLKECEIKSSTMGVEQARYKAMSQDMLNEMQQLRKQLHMKQIETEELIQSQRQFKTKEKDRKLQLENKYREIDSLVEQLNHYQQELLKEKTLYSQAVKKYETQLIKQQNQMQVLKEEAKNMQAASSIEKMQNNASLSVFGSQKQEVNEQHKAFLELQQRQTQETNALRQQLQLKGEQMHRIQLENQQLKSKIRRAEQENQLGGRTLAVNLNNLKQAKEANQLVLRSEVQSLKRKITSLQMRLKNKQNEVSEKNRFIKQFLMTDIQARQDASKLVSRLEEALNK